MRPSVCKRNLLGAVWEQMWSENVWEFEFGPGGEPAVVPVGNFQHQLSTANMQSSIYLTRSATISENLGSEFFRRS